MWLGVTIDTASMPSVARGLGPRHLAEVRVGAVGRDAEVLGRQARPLGSEDSAPRHQLPSVVDAGSRCGGRRR
jgi:hypothetical protein